MINAIYAQFRIWPSSASFSPVSSDCSNDRERVRPTLVGDTDPADLARDLTDLRHYVRRAAFIVPTRCYGSP
jgi:hypothetical protein